MAINLLYMLNLLVAVTIVSALGSAAQYSPSTQTINPHVRSHEELLVTIPDSHSDPEKETSPQDLDRSSLDQMSLMHQAVSKTLKRELYGETKKYDKKKPAKKEINIKPYKKETKKKITTVPSTYKPKKAVKQYKSGKPMVRPYKPGKSLARPPYKSGKSQIRSYAPPKGSSKGVMNQIDECWRNDPNWAQNRMHLADCAIGFGFDAMGGKGGNIYVVTDPSDDNPASPKPGTLRYGVVQLKPLWIIFKNDMSIKLSNELIITSYKTIDGRGARVEIAYGSGLTIQDVNHVIIHGLSIHHCIPGKSGQVMSSTDHVGYRQGSDGDAISILGASHIWIDHNYFAACQDGLVDAIHSSTAITVSNNFFTDHDKVMLLGHSDSYPADKGMRVTVIYNHFGPNLVQRMPRCRFGHFHVANNRYTEWEMYAIGASADPTIISDGNYFFAPDDTRFKQVVKLEGARRTSSSEWVSTGDLFLNGAYFGEVGTSSYRPSYTEPQENFNIVSATLVPALTADAGPLSCSAYSRC